MEDKKMGDGDWSGSGRRWDVLCVPCVAMCCHVKMFMELFRQQRTGEATLISQWHVVACTVLLGH